MDVTGPLMKYLLLFIVAVGWVYYRLVRSRRKRSGAHGRELLRERFRQRRLDRLSSAQTWGERRELMQDGYAGRRIRPQFLQDGESTDAPGGARKDDDTAQEIRPPAREGPNG